MAAEKLERLLNLNYHYMKKKTTQKRKRLKELKNLIESCDEIISDADIAQFDLEEYQKEYKKLTGKEYEY